MLISTLAALITCDFFQMPPSSVSNMQQQQMMMQQQQQRMQMGNNMGMGMRPNQMDMNGGMMGHPGMRPHMNPQMMMQMQQQHQQQQQQQQQTQQQQQQQHPMQGPNRPPPPEYNKMMPHQVLNIQKFRFFPKIHSKSFRTKT